MKIAKLVAVLYLVFSSQLAFAESENQKLWNRFSVGIDYGYYHFPGGLLRLEKSIVASPDKFYGSIRGVQLDFAVDDDWLVGLNLFKIEARGYGLWERSDTKDILTANGVTGTASGRTDWDWQGFTCDAEYRFLDGNFRPYVRTGVGAGELSVNFNGQFNGHETMSGFDFPVTEPAIDLVKKLVPIFKMEFGARFMPISGLILSPAFFWIDGGYGPKMNIGWRF